MIKKEFLCQILLLVKVLLVIRAEIPDRDQTDYCELFGEDDIKGKKQVFLAGNHVYYFNDGKETIGLTHPFYHDLRSRGTGITYYEGVGTGNDFYGWEFHRDVKVAFGSIISEDFRWESPAPTKMFWRPDKMIMEYELTSPYFQVNVIREATGCPRSKFSNSNCYYSETVHLRP